MSYQIKNYSYKQADLLGVEIKPSVKKNKKIDVFKNGKLILSIGSLGYKDYPTYIEENGVQYANKRRALYKKRHDNNRHFYGSAGYYADKILW